MIVLSKNAKGIVKDFHGVGIALYVPKHSWEKYVVKAELSKGSDEKALLSFDSFVNSAYHICGVGVAPCYHVFGTLIERVLAYDSDATITCAGVLCNSKALVWKDSIKNVLPCKGEKNDIQEAKILEYEEKNKASGFKVHVPKPSKPKANLESSIVDFPGEYPPVLGTLEEIPIGGKSKSVRSVHGAVYNFYALEEASLSDNVPVVFQARHKEFVESTARTMFDYLATICMSECRHAYETSWNVYNDGKKSRNNAWILGRHYNPRQSLKVCEYLFTHAGFPGGYGGKAWAKIAHCALRYFDLPVKSWFDHVVDLAHNGGLAFNKGVFWWNPGNNNHYIEMLNRRKKGSVFDDGDDPYNMQTFQSTHGEMKWLLYCSGLIDEPGPKIAPLKWGEKLVKCELGAFGQPEHDDDDDSDSDEAILKKLRYKRVV